MRVHLDNIYLFIFPCLNLDSFFELKFNKIFVNCNLLQNTGYNVLFFNKSELIYIITINGLHSTHQCKNINKVILYDLFK